MVTSPACADTSLLPSMPLISRSPAVSLTTMFVWRGSSMRILAPSFQGVSVRTVAREAFTSIRSDTSVFFSRSSHVTRMRSSRDPTTSYSPASSSRRTVPPETNWRSVTSAVSAVDPPTSNASAAATGITVVRIFPASWNMITIPGPRKMRDNSKEFPNVHPLHPVGGQMRNTPQPAPAFRSCMRILLPAVCLAAAIVAYPSAQGDLDTLMSDVLTRRDDNWKKLQQYTLTERETLQITALAVFRLFGFEREYLWFPREGFFIRSPLKADGVPIAEEKRREEEDRWLRQSQNREKRLAERATGSAERRARGARDSGDASSPQLPGDMVMTGAVEDVIVQNFEPQFIRSANFLRFKFDQGQYALVGREKML